MSDTASNLRGGEFATSRRGSPDSWERAFVAQKRFQGVSDFTIANMLGRPLAAILALPRAAHPVLVTHNEVDPEHAPSPVIKRGRRPTGSPPDYGQMPKRVRELAVRVAERHRLKLEDLVGPRVTHRISHARHEAFAEVRSITKGTSREAAYSLPQIGAWFGGRDHTTVLAGIRGHLRRRAKFLGEWKSREGGDGGAD